MVVVQGFHCDISIYTCIVPLIGSFPPLFSLVPYSPSYGDFNRFQCSIFIQKVHQPYSPSLLFFIYFLFPTSDLPLTQPVLCSCPSLFRCLFIVQWEFCLSLLPVNITCLSQSSLPSLVFLTLFPHPVLFSSFQCVSLCLIPTHIIIHFLSFFPSFPPPLVSPNSSAFGNMFYMYLYAFICIGSVLNI
jgi:hypothetical protein